MPSPQALVHPALMTVSVSRLRRQYDRQIQKKFHEAEKLSMNGRHRAAIQIFDRLLDADPAYSEARNNRALEFDALGNADRAVEELQYLLEIDSAFRLAYTNLAVILCNHHRYREAESNIRKGIELLGEWPKANLTLAVVLTGQGQWTSEAREHLKRAAAQDKTAEVFLQSWPDWAK